MTNAEKTLLLEKAKVALRVMTHAFDEEILDLIAAGEENLQTRGVVVSITPLVTRNIITYVRMNFGDPSDYERLKESYDEQLGQLMTTTGYTVWEGSNGSD